MQYLSFLCHFKVEIVPSYHTQTRTDTFPRIIKFSKMLAVTIMPSENLAISVEQELAQSSPPSFPFLIQLSSTNNTISCIFSHTHRIFALPKLYLSFCVSAIAQNKNNAANKIYKFLYVVVLSVVF